MKRPNLFIVGAPKCGTTALASYLGDHPAVFMCEPKEPHFFAEDFPRNRYVEDLDSYLALFSAAKPRVRVCGEASVWYFYSNVALRGIREFAPDARIIVLLRSPPDMLYSIHAEHLYNCNEDVADFSQAYGLQGIRRRGERLPQGCRHPIMLQYSALGRYAAPLAHIFELFGRDRTKTILFDDLATDSRTVYREVLNFLGLEDDGRREFPRVNPSKAYRAAVFARLLQHPPGPTRDFVKWLRGKSGIDLRKPALWLRAFNTTASKRPVLDSRLRERIWRDVEADVAELSTLLKRDLSHWSHSTLEAPERPANSTSR
jgi:hypothetical protein